MSWFKCFPEKFLNGVYGLTPNEGWVYTVLIMQMYDGGGSVPENNEWLAKRCNMRVDSFKRSVNALISLGKIYRSNKMLRNPTVDHIVQSSDYRRTRQVGVQKPNKINEGIEKQPCLDLNNSSRASQNLNRTRQVGVQKPNKINEGIEKQPISETEFFKNSVKKRKDDISKILSKEEESNIGQSLDEGKERVESPPYSPPQKNGAEEFYISKKGKKLTGDNLANFNRFWKAFAMSKGKAAAADAFLQVIKLADVEVIIAGAAREASLRNGIVAKGLVPKWAEGWLRGRRWEDADVALQSIDWPYRFRVFKEKKIWPITWGPKPTDGDFKKTVSPSVYENWIKTMDTS